MSRSAVARNYAATLLELGERENAAEAYLEHLGVIAGLYRLEPSFRAFLATPRIPLADKKQVLRSAFAGEVPEPLLRFLFVVLEKRRQGLLTVMEEELRQMLDDRAGRVRASITLATEPDEALRSEIEEALERVLGRDVIAEFRSDEAILGGLVVRAEDLVLDGSLRHRVHMLRRSLVEQGSAPSADG